MVVQGQKDQMQATNKHAHATLTCDVDNEMKRFVGALLDRSSYRTAMEKLWRNSGSKMSLQASVYDCISVGRAQTA